MEIGDTPHPASAVPPLATLKQYLTLAVNLLRLHKVRCNITQFVCPCADFFMAGPFVATLCQDWTWRVAMPLAGRNLALAPPFRCPASVSHAHARGVRF